jgi:hypothetical protein
MSPAARAKALSWGGVVLAGIIVCVTLLAYMKPGNEFALMQLLSFCR